MTIEILCLGCSATLSPDNFALADGCPCNSPRGVNHGRVPVDVCTCNACDPAQSGASRRRCECPPGVQSSTCAVHGYGYPAPTEER